VVPVYSMALWLSDGHGDAAGGSDCLLPAIAERKVPSQARAHHSVVCRTVPDRPFFNFFEGQ
jgi:hypothetical protein